MPPRIAANDDHQVVSLSAVRDTKRTGWLVQPPDIARSTNRSMGAGAIVPGCWPKAMPKSKGEICPAEPSSRAFVRCCPHWPWRWSEVRPCWTLTEPGSSTPLHTTLALAHAGCEDLRMRLCTRSEILSKHCCYSGHGVDHKLVWASADSCTYDPRAAGLRVPPKGDFRPSFLSGGALPQWALPLHLRPSTPWRAPKGTAPRHGRGDQSPGSRKGSSEAELDEDRRGKRLRQVRVALQISGCARGLIGESATRQKLIEIERVLRMGWKMDVFCALEACSKQEESELRAGGLQRYALALSKAGAHVSNCTVVERIFTSTGHLKEPYSLAHPMVGKLHWPFRYNARGLVSMFWKLFVVGEMRRESRRHYSLVWQSRTDIALNGDAPSSQRFDWQMSMRRNVDWSELASAVHLNSSVFYSDDAPLDEPCTSDMGMVLSQGAADHLRLAWYGLAALHTYIDWPATAERFASEPRRI